MVTLNLINQQAGGITYRLDSFPDGQHNIVLLDWNTIAENVIIVTRITSWVDIEKIVCASASLRNAGVRTISLYVTYFLGARSDRKFEPGGNNYLRDVICPVINSLGFKKVLVVDPHSEILSKHIENFEIGSPSVFHFYTEAINNISVGFDVLQPDAGAHNRTQLFFQCIQKNIGAQLIVASKTRKEDGSIDVEFDKLPFLNKDLVICDDICDGGGTFIALAKKLREKGYKGNLHLIVTHGIFSKGVDILFEHFKTINYSNSYQVLDKRPNLHCHIIVF